MTDKKVFYKKRLIADDTGLHIDTQRFISIHETRCFYFCIDDYSIHQIKYQVEHKGETALQAAKTMHCKVRRIAKDGSRIAFDTEEKAFAHLRMLKQRQVQHLERDLRNIKHFLSIKDFEKKHGSYLSTSF